MANRSRVEISHHDWLIFTCTSGVAAYFDRLFLRGKDVRPGRAKITAVAYPLPPTSALEVLARELSAQDAWQELAVAPAA